MGCRGSGGRLLGQEATTVRYFKLLGDGPVTAPDWGRGLYYFELDDEGYPRRQVEVYPQGPVLHYGPEHLHDAHGRLGDQVLDVRGSAAEPITGDEFERAWVAAGGPPHAPADWDEPRSDA